MQRLMEANNTYEWDYLGWKKRGQDKSYQRDWNQTLLTMINQASAKIQKTTLRGGGNVVYMHPKVFTIIKSLEYHDASSNTLSGRYCIRIDDRLPKDRLYVKFDETLNKGVFKLPENHIMAIKHKASSESGKMDEVSITILEIGSKDYEKYKDDPSYTFLTDKICTGEIIITNHNTIDPVTGELLIDYHNEISQDICMGTYSDEPELSDLVTVRADISDDEVKTFLKKRIESLKKLNNPLITAEPYEKQLASLTDSKITIKKPWYKKLLEVFKIK